MKEINKKELKNVVGAGEAQEIKLNSEVFSKKNIGNTGPSWCSDCARR